MRVWRGRRNGNASTEKNGGADMYYAVTEENGRLWVKERRSSGDAEGGLLGRKEISELTATKVKGKRKSVSTESDPCESPSVVGFEDTFTFSNCTES